MTRGEFLRTALGTAAGFAASVIAPYALEAQDSIVETPLTKEDLCNIVRYIMVADREIDYFNRGGFGSLYFTRGINSHDRRANSIKHVLDAVDTDDLVVRFIDSANPERYVETLLTGAKDNCGKAPDGIDASCSLNRKKTAKLFDYLTNTEGLNMRGGGKVIPEAIPTFLRVCPQDEIVLDSNEVWTYDEIASVGNCFLTFTYEQNQNGNFVVKPNVHEITSNDGVTIVSKPLTVNLGNGRTRQSIGCQGMSGSPAVAIRVQKHADGTVDVLEVLRAQLDGTTYLISIGEVMKASGASFTKSVGPGTDLEKLCFTADLKLNVVSPLYESEPEQ